MSEMVESVDTCWNDYASMRKGIFVELFLEYLVYMVISIGSYYQNPDQDIANTKQQNDGAAPTTQIQPKASLISIEQLNKFFTIFFGYHVIPVGMSLLYQPRIYSIVLVYLHFAAFLVILLAHYKEREQFLKGGYAASGLFNVMLILGAIVGLSQTEDGCP